MVGGEYPMRNGGSTQYCRYCAGVSLDHVYSANEFDYRRGASGGEFQLGRCSRCGLVNTLGVTDEDLERSYSSDYYGSSSNKFNRSIEWVLQRISRRRAESIIKEWKRDNIDHCSPSVLDIGCGRGQLLQAFQAIGANVLGIERKEFQVDETNKDAVYLGSLADEVLLEKKFDIVIVWHVLEHLENLENYFELIRDHMNRNGLLIIAVPNFNSTQQMVFKKNWFHLDLPRHLVHFQDHWLDTELQKSGFRIERVDHLDAVQNLYGFIQSALNVVFSSRPNEFYQMLKISPNFRNVLKPKFFLFILLATLLIPLAVIESVFSVFTQKGATIQIRSRLA